MTTPAQPPDDTDGQGGEIMTRDLGAGNEDGPQLTQFETPSARGGSNRGDGVIDKMERDKPKYSPVAQPGMDQGRWFHTVESRTGDGRHESPKGRKGRRHERKGRRGRRHHG